MVLACGLVLIIGLPLLRELARGFPCIWTPGQCHSTDAYAEDFFADLTPISDALASRRSSEGVVPSNLDGFDCTYAIVALDQRAPVIPPARRKTGTPDMDWGGGWRAVTALTEKENEDLRSLLAICGGYWPVKLQKQLAEALADRRMLISGRVPYRQVNLYLPPEAGVGLAARIRFGD